MEKTGKAWNRRGEKWKKGGSWERGWKNKLFIGKSCKIFTV